MLNLEIIKGNSLDELMNKSFRKLKEAPEVPTRQGTSSKEIVGMEMINFQPQNTWIQNIARKHNVYHQIAESVWVLSGHSKLDFLEKFLPRCRDFSDDNIHWSSGYGDRIMNWKGSYINSQNDNIKIKDNIKHVNQWYNVLEELKRSPNSRQAVISLWDPIVDGDFSTSKKDTACNNHIQFLLRDNKLHMMVRIRSNDAIWGFSAINHIQWSLMQQLSAAFLGVELGVLKFSQGSYHVYSQHYKRLDNILDEYSKNSNKYWLKSETKVIDDKVFEPIKNIDALDTILQTSYKIIDTGVISGNHLFKRYPTTMNTLTVPFLKSMNKSLAQYYVKYRDYENNLHKGLNNLVNEKIR